jgi:outer membrane protein OmpA-like peptidoglycan-associated protein
MPNLNIARALVICAPVFLLGACACNTEVPAAAAPAPMPVVAAAAPTTIYFEWDKSSLTPEAQSVVSQLAHEGKSPYAVIGNTDTSGSTEYNQDLGQRRADTVTAALKAENASVCNASSDGENNLAVKTGDDVREPLNRRAAVESCK